MSIKLQTIKVGHTSIKLPVWDKKGKVAGNTIVITAGVDGDEYTGIEAAYELIRVYSAKDFSGRFFILPLVNISGFEQPVSFNPLDNKFPKYFYPGNK